MVDRKFSICDAKAASVLQVATMIPSDNKL